MVNDRIERYQYPSDGKIHSNIMYTDRTLDGTLNL